jgi:hypothetical protein
MATATDVQAAIDGIDAKLTSGVTQMAGQNRMMKFDFDALRERRAELVTQLNALTGARPMVRRILTFASTKGL